MTGYCRSDVAHVATTIGEMVNLLWVRSSNECGLKRVSPVQKNSAMRKCIESRSAEDGSPIKLQLQLQISSRDQMAIRTRRTVVIRDTIEMMLTMLI